MFKILLLLFTLSSYAVGAMAHCEPLQCGIVEKCFVGGKIQKGPEDNQRVVKFAMCKFQGDGDLFIYETRNAKHLAAIKSGKVCAQVCGDETKPEIKVFASVKKS
ncbi:MAG: hypothetical protein ACOYL6_12170 [Bacteriovoracaceae bacterium]